MRPRYAPGFRKTLVKLELIPRWLTSADFHLAFTPGVSPNRVCFERELLDHHRLAFEKNAADPASTRPREPASPTGAVALTLDALWPEPTLTADGAWWHPVVIANPAKQVTSVPLPLVTVLAVISATLGDPSRDRGDALVAFRCT